MPYVIEATIVIDGDRRKADSDPLYQIVTDALRAAGYAVNRGRIYTRHANTWDGVTPTYKIHYKTGENSIMCDTRTVRAMRTAAPRVEDVTCLRCRRAMREKGLIA